MTVTEDRAKDRRPAGPGDDVPGLRTPPHDMIAEQAVLGSMLLSKDAIADVVDQIGREDFYRPVHQAIYASILDLYGRGEPADAVTVAADLGRRGQLVRIGGAPYLTDLLQAVPTAASARFYAGIVAQKSTMRRLAAAGTRIAAWGYNDAEGEDVDTVVDQAQQEIYNVTETRRSAGSGFMSFGELLPSTLDEIDSLSNGQANNAVLTGFQDLDELTNGLQPGQLIVIGARPGAGKSTLAMDIMRHCSLRHGKPSVIFSLEMSQNEIMMRIISAQASIKLADIRSGRCSDDDWTRMARMMADHAEAPLFIDDSPNLTLMEIRAKARRLKQKHGLALIVVDYLQLMTGAGRNAHSREQEVAEYSRSLKLLAKDVDVPVIALSQLNRKAEERHDKRPQLADLRESGGVEQDSDMVILIHRPDAYDRDDPRGGEADLILAKNRHGSTKTLSICHQLHFSRFADMARFS